MKWLCLAASQTHTDKDTDTPEEMYSMHPMTTEVSTVIFFLPKGSKLNNCVPTNAKLNIPTVRKLTLYMKYIYLEKIRLYVYTKEEFKQNV